MARENVKANIHIDADLCKVIGDPRSLENVFTNLISNALKFSSEYQKVDISANLSDDGSACVFCVRDHGIGIAPEHQAVIFESFYQGINFIVVECRAECCELCRVHDHDPFLFHRHAMIVDRVDVDRK